MSQASQLAVLASIVDLLEEIGVTYLVGGSFASGVHGEPRQTRDADLVVALTATQARLLAERLGPDYYADVRMMEDALRRQISFNVIHIPSSFKLDFFPAGSDAFRNSELQNRRLQQLGPRSIYMSTPEDTILAKLRWYREGGEVSDRQWRDVIGVIEVQGNRLDVGRLREWAPRLAVDDLLERALAEAKPPSD